MHACNITGSISLTHTQCLAPIKKRTVTIISLVLHIGLCTAVSPQFFEVAVSGVVCKNLAAVTAESDG